MSTWENLNPDVKSKVKNLIRNLKDQVHQDYPELKKGIDAALDQLDQVNLFKTEETLVNNNEGEDWTQQWVQLPLFMNGNGD